MSLIKEHHEEKVAMMRAKREPQFPSLDAKKKKKPLHQKVLNYQFVELSLGVVH